MTLPPLRGTSLLDMVVLYKNLILSISNQILSKVFSLLKNSNLSSLLQQINNKINDHIIYMTIKLSKTWCVIALASAKISLCA